MNEKLKLKFQLGESDNLDGPWEPIPDDEYTVTATMQAIKDLVAEDDEAYIPFGKAIELSSGVLTRKKLDKAISQGDPIKIRCKKPSKNRKNVHIQDVLKLINKISSSEKITEEAAKLFGRWKDELQQKNTNRVNTT